MIFNMKKLLSIFLSSLFGVSSNGSKLIENMNFNEIYKLATERNNAKAQLYLGVFYEKGNEVEQDYIKAAQWYEKSALQNNPIAQLALAMLYDNGNGVKQDYIKAKQWYEKAARQGNANAQ